MAILKFYCHQCGQKIGIDQRYVGTQVECPQCKAPLLVPAPPGSPQVAPRADEAGPPAEETPRQGVRGQAKPGGSAKRFRPAVVGCVVMGIACALVIVVCITSSDNSQKRTGQGTATSMESDLAVIETNGAVPEDGVMLARFRSLLDQLDAKFVENRQQIADLTGNGQRVLLEDGVRESLLRIMEGMNQIMPEKVENQKYSEYVASYIVLRVTGNTHDQAVLGLKEALHGMLKLTDGQE